jgi:2-methylaconitate cis-trans-isomerase PrpF
MKIPCAIYRGGTSKPIFFLEKDLPQDPKKRDRKKDGHLDLAKAALVRTARLLMDGFVHLSDKILA